RPQPQEHDAPPLGHPRQLHGPLPPRLRLPDSRRRRPDLLPLLLPRHDRHRRPPLPRHPRLLAAPHLPFHLQLPLDPRRLRHRPAHHARARGAARPRPQDRRRPPDQAEQEDCLWRPGRVVRARVHLHHGVHG
ncbi:hypothetical protein BN1708_019401, partial [Verticillium longisporum]